MLRAHVPIGLLVLSAGAVAAPAASPEDSIVRVFTTMRLPNPVRPWTRQNPIEVMGTGVVIEGRRILTNAHVVLYASEVLVQARQGGERYPAKVATLGPGIDLATLELEDPAFFEGRPPIPRDRRRPEASAKVAVYGFPVGGSNLAITGGVVSRVEYARYDEVTEGLRIQVDAALNPGGSGGPALVGGEMIGLTFGKLARAEGIGYIIPSEEIETYLADVADGRYDGKPRIVDRFQTLENEALRAKLGLARSVRGIMVREPARRDPAYPLREADVLTRIGETEIDDEGMVQYEEDLRLPFLALVPKLAEGGKVRVTILRDGRPEDVDLPVLTTDDRLIKSYNGGYPSYFLHGPLVFSPVVEEATSAYVQLSPNALAQGSPLLARGGDRARFPGEELVVVTSPMLAHRIARGYADPFGQIVSDVNGVPIRSLRHLVEILRDAEGEFLTFRFAGEGTEVLVFRRRAMNEATGEVMAENGIPRPGTADVISLWDGKVTSSR